MADRITAPQFPELDFKEEPHIYLLDGVQIPSVSAIMEPLSRAKYDGINEAVLQKAADRGTAIHNAIENYVLYGIVDIPQDFKPYIDAFLDWWDLAKPDAVGTEIRMYHKLMNYAGTCDLLCYIGGELNLIDYKSTYAVSEKLCGVQLEAYRQALKSHEIEIARKRILHLKKDGKHRVVEFPTEDGARWRVFGACKTVYDYNHG